MGQEQPDLLRRRRLGRLGRLSWGWGGWGGWGTGGNDNNCSAANHNTWNGCITDRGPSNAPGNSTWDQVVTEPDGTTNSLLAGRTVRRLPGPNDGPELQLDGDEQPRRLHATQRQHQPADRPGLGLAVAGRRRPPHRAGDQTPTTNYKKIIILLSDGLNTEDRWYGNGSNTSTAVDNRMYQTGNGSGTCANIKAAGITIYTIQVNTGGDPTSTLLQNCASSSDKFYLLTSASDIASAFTSIGSELTKLRVAK